MNLLFLLDDQEAINAVPKTSNLWPIERSSVDASKQGALQFCHRCLSHSAGGTHAKLF